MLLTLNDDCLLLICEYLDVCDHIAVASTCQRLGAVIQNLYRFRSIKTNHTFWRYCEEHEEMLLNFWQLVSVNLQKLTLEPKQAQHVNLMQLCRLPKLKHFSFSLPNVDFRMQVDTLHSFLESSCLQLQHLELKNIYWENFQALQTLRFPKLSHLELLTKHLNLKPAADFNEQLFPQVKTLILNNVNWGQGLWTLHNLTELVLEKCTRILPQHVEQILLHCSLRRFTIICTLDFHNGNCHNIQMADCYKAIKQCQTLEELNVDYHYFCMFEHELPHLRKLRKLNFLPPSYCLCACKERRMSREIVEHFTSATKTLTLKLAELTENWQTLQTFILGLKKVECLKIIYTRCKSDHIRMLAQVTAKTLRAFHFHGVLEWSGTQDFAYFNYSGLLNVLVSCKQLEVFDISETYCNDAFFEQAVDTLSNNFADRQLPLLFRFNQAPIDMNNLKKLKLPSYLSISNEKMKRTATVGIQCEW